MKVYLISALLGLSACTQKISKIEIRPANLVIKKGETHSVQVAAFGTDGKEIVGSSENPQGIEVVWRIADEKIAKIEELSTERQWVPKATVTALTPGTTQVHAIHKSAGETVLNITVK